MLCRKGILKNFWKLTEKKPVSEFLFLKKRLQHRWFPINFAKFLRTPFLLSTSGGCFSQFWSLWIHRRNDQMNFWISHDLLHLSIFSSSWHFCINFWRAQALLFYLDGHVVEEIWRIWFVTWPQNWSITWLFGWGHRPCE